jgi:Meiotically Up-regulated Gene 113 (MUG113) protein
MSIKVVRSPKPTVFYIDEEGFISDETGRPHSLDDVKTLKEACERSLKQTTVQQILTDPDSVAHFGELLHDLSSDEVLEIWQAVQDESLLSWAHEKRQESRSKTTGVPEDKPGFIYLCKNNRNGLIKIGFSHNPRHREATLQSEEPEVSFIHVMPGNWADEQAIHARFKYQRQRGEWFRLSETDIQSIILSG